MMSALKTMVHVESRSRSLSVRKTSATPASPECVARRMCSTYLALGGASYQEILSIRLDRLGNRYVYMYISVYIYICACVCVCVCVRGYVRVGQGL